MTPTKTNILNRTGLKEEQYENIVFKTYLMCMSEIARTPQHLQLLLINRPINKWFLTEVEKLNKEFIEVTIPYLPLNKEHVAKSYKNYIKRIPQNYPSALVDAVKIKQEELILLSN